MNATAITRPRPWWQAVLAGMLVPAGFAILSFLIVADMARMASDPGHNFKEGGGPVAPPEAAAGLLPALAVIAIAALLFAILLAAMMAAAERETARPPLLWESAGLAAMVPPVIAWFAMLILSPTQANADWTWYVYPLPVFALLAIFGANAARRVRHGPRQ